MDSPADGIAVAIISHRKIFSFLRFFGPLRSAKITFREGEKKKYGGGNIIRCHCIESLRRGELG